MNTANDTAETTVEVREIPITFEASPYGHSPGDLHPEETALYRKAFAAELEHLPDIRDRLLDLAQRAGYEADVEVAISSITDAADEIIDAVEADDPDALAGD